MQIISRSIDALNEKIGVYGSYLILPLVGVVVYEVFMRYVFDAPTSWGFEMTTFLYGVHFMLALGFAHKHDGHVSIDVFEARLPARMRTKLRIISNLVIFIPTIGLLTIWSIKYAATSWGFWERASSSWAPAVYPYKTLMAIGFVLLFLQGIAKLIQDFCALRNND
jgi:TRAP-type mannitol/chloroaromatic compound transport system permease small subunit